MSHENIIRAWKNEDFRNSLSDEQRAMLPEHPAGLIELKPEELRSVAGGLRGTIDTMCQCDSLDYCSTHP
jgi:mersacidin/lichenicidin family type 2 lantibiotic